MLGDELWLSCAFWCSWFFLDSQEFLRDQTWCPFLGFATSSMSWSSLNLVNANFYLVLKLFYFVLEIHNSWIWVMSAFWLQIFRVAYGVLITSQYSHSAYYHLSSKAFDDWVWQLCTSTICYTCLLLGTLCNSNYSGS